MYKLCLWPSSHKGQRMADYNFLELVNKAARRFNETPLTSSNFAGAGGFYATTKDAVNAAIRDINQAHFQWPWNHTTQTDTLTPGEMRYDFQADAKNVDFDSFRIRRSLSFGNVTVKLQKIDYEEFLHYHSDSEYSTQGGFSDGFDDGFQDSEGEGIPRYVFQTQSLKYGLWPIPDEEYILDYEYFKLPLELENFDDVPSVPQAFSYIIQYGSLMHMYAFRDDQEMFDRYQVLFKDGIDNLRTIYINRYDHIRDRRINRGNYNGRYT